MHLILQTADAARGPTWQPGEAAAMVAALTSGLVIAFLVYRFIRRVPWPRPFRLRFIAFHLVMAPLAGAAWFALSAVLGVIVPGVAWELNPGARMSEFVFIGSVLYTVIAGVSYAEDASARAANAEAMAARTQLAALRAQVHPHFLFNALHTVVQLIPIDPPRAMEAAELVADLLRTTLGEQRDEVRLDEEWRFVSRYLAIERIRFGDRLVVREEIDDDVLDECVPAFALQTLVENAVRHGAAPRVAPTEIVVTATGSGSRLTLSVRNSGDGAPAVTAETGAGTGLVRLRERLAVLHGTSARLASGATEDGGYEAVLTLPRGRGRDA